MDDTRTVMDQLADILEEAFAPRKQCCSFGKLLEEAPDKVRNSLISLMGNPEISTRKIHLVLKKSGASIGRDTIADHRARLCTCFPAKKESK